LSGQYLVVGAPDRIHPGDGGIGSVFVYRVIDGIPVFDAELIPVPEVGSNQFGTSVIIDGDRVLITSSRRLYVFHRVNDQWTEEQVLWDGIVDSIYRPGALDGDRMVLARPIDGFAFITSDFNSFKREGDSWAYENRHIADGADIKNEYGRDMELVGNSVLASDPAYSTITTGQIGAVQVYRYTGSFINPEWIKVQTIVADDPMTFDVFGESISLSGSKLIVGSKRTDGAEFRSGAAYVFTLKGSVWTQDQKLVDPIGQTGDLFGISVSMSDGYAIVGSPNAFSLGLGPPAGAASLFVLSDDVWSYQSRIIPSESRRGDFFGIEADTGGGYAAFGTPSDIELGEDAGAVWFFKLCGVDINNDGTVDTADLGLFISGFGESDSRLDFNSDGVVDTADLGVLISEFGTSCP